MDLKKYQAESIQQLDNFLRDAPLEGFEQSFLSHATDKVSYKVKESLADVPYVCLRIPTGGGKTILGAHIIRTTRSYLNKDYPLVLWMVPTTQIKTQTLEALRNIKHPYRRELESAFPGKVRIFDLQDFLSVQPHDITQGMSVLVGTFATAKVAEEENRLMYQDHEDMQRHFEGLTSTDGLTMHKDGERPNYSFDNVLRMHRPLIITDEAHNANTQLSYEVYERFYPGAIIELTATPNKKLSNVLVNVPASALKTEQMIKLPVVVKEHFGGWEQCLAHSLQRRQYLEDLAKKEPEHKGYVRPILLIKAENKGGVATVEKVYRHLIDSENIPEEEIRIATGEQRQLDDVDLFDPDCPVRVIITKDALKEGWDCSFAYVLCSLANQKSDTAIFQLLGRVLRMPYAEEREHPDLNKAYAHVVSSEYGEVASELTDDLEKMGFTDFEARQAIQEEEPEGLPLVGGVDFLHNQMTLTLPSEPDLSGIPDADVEKIEVTQVDAKSWRVVLKGVTDDATREAIAKALPVKLRKQAVERLSNFNQRTRSRESPAGRGATLQVPIMRYCVQGELIEVASIGLPSDWQLTDYPANLESVVFAEESKTYLVDIDGKEVKYKPDTSTNKTPYRQAKLKDWDLPSLVQWLDQEMSKTDQSATRKQRVPWIADALRELEGRGFSQGQLWQSKYIIKAKLDEQFRVAKFKAQSAVRQDVLFNNADAVDVDFAYSYTFDRSYYPAVRECRSNYQWDKHFYPVPGELDWKTDAGKVTEEFLCARALDEMDEVEVWVRNLEKDGQFELPTSKRRTFPDFVARLKDGRLLVVEYKGKHLESNEDSKDKELWGKLWAKASNGKCLYLMARKQDEAGLSVREQLAKAIA